MINNGRLQFAHKSKILSNREVAYKFIEKYIKQYGILIGEPIVVRYYTDISKNNSSAILAIGEGTKYQVIDIAQINETTIDLYDTIDQYQNNSQEVFVNLYSQLSSEINRSISKDKEIEHVIDNIQKQVNSNELVSINSELNSTSAYFLKKENGTEIVLDVKLDDNGCEFLKHSGNGLSDLGIKDYVADECDIIKNMLNNVETNNKNEHNQFEDYIEKINNKIGDGFVDETITKSVSDIKNKLDIFFDENAISDNTINTLKEIQEYIASDDIAANKMVEDITANRNAINSESAIRQEKDLELYEKINIEKEERKTAINELINSYKSDDNTIVSKINEESIARQNSDNELTEKITSLAQKDAINHQDVLDKISLINGSLTSLSGIVENNEIDIETKLETLDKREISHHNYLINELTNTNNEIETLKNEDVEIELRIQTIEDSYAKNTDLTSEILRAKNSEENLSKNISTLESEVNGKITDAINSADEKAENAYNLAETAQNNITIETINRTNDVSTLSQKIENESKTRQDNDTILLEKINLLDSKVGNNTLDDVRTLAQQGVNDAATAKGAADAAQGEVDALETVVSAETKAREEADADLLAKINAEVLARATADTNLQTMVEELIERITNIEESLKHVVKSVTTNDPDLSVIQSGNTVTIGFNRE